MHDLTDRIVKRWLFAKATKVVYTGVFFSNMEKARLLKKLGKDHPVAYADHMTIWYFDDGGDPNLNSLSLGKSVSLKVIEVFSDDQIQVALVKPPSIVRPRSTRIPHITISAEPGVSPKQSNDLIFHSTYNGPQTGLPTVTGKVGWFDGENVRFDLPEAF